jgi:hypothetical protein
MGRIATTPEVAKAIIFLTSEHAVNITGHIMRVDGGKAITSRGQQDWYGMKFMNRKFEQEPPNMIKKIMKQRNGGQRPPQGRAALEKWYED